MGEQYKNCKGGHIGCGGIRIQVTETTHPCLHYLVQEIFTGLNSEDKSASDY